MTGAAHDSGSVSRRTILCGATSIGAAAYLAATPGISSAAETDNEFTLDGPRLLCEPYLLDPQLSRVYVVWHTEDPGSHQVVVVGAGVPTMTDAQLLAVATGDDGSSTRGGWRRFAATSTRLSRTREDATSQVPGRVYAAVEIREVWRHLAEVRKLSSGRTPYRVVSINRTRRVTITPTYSLAPALAPWKNVRLLLTSDHQLKPMTPANLEAVAQTIGTQFDGVLMAGDCVNIADRPSEWFDSSTGLAFFAAFHGRANQTIAGRTYRGAPILQHTPIFPAIGNHEVMGRQSATDPLTTQFHNAQPTKIATQRWERTRPTGVDRESWIADHSWNVTTYEEMFPFPNSTTGGRRWYSRIIGNVFLVSLFVTAIWRPGTSIDKGKFQEAPGSLGDPTTWGHGQFIFEPVSRGSRQYQWLGRKLRSDEARQAKYRVVMFHHSSHGLGDNSAPPFTDPMQTLALDPRTGAVTSVTYSYPLANDHILRDVEPLLNESEVNLVFSGHAHVWNRFRNAAGVNWLETSNVGNTQGAFDVSSGASRSLPASPNHVPQGDPGRLSPVVPTVAPLVGAQGTALPYLASNAITAYSILDSGAGTVRSYRFNTQTPDSAPVLFDEFPLA